MSGSRRGGLGRGIGALIPSGPAVLDRDGVERDGVERDGVERDGVERDGVERDGVERDGVERDGVEPDGLEAAVETETAEPPLGPDGSSEPLPPAAASPSPVSRETWSAVDDGAASSTELVAVPGAYFLEIPVESIRANAKQPRTVFDDDALAELTHSIREFGVLQPVVVRAVDDGYELVMGERRLRGAVAAGLAAIPAVVRDTADDAMLRDALLENVHRTQLNPLEEAAAYQQLLEEFGVTHEQLAARIGRSRSQVSNTVRLMNLSIPVQRRVAAGVLSAGHARALLALTDSDAQDDLAGRIVAEGLSVRATEELVALAAHDGPSKRRRPVRRITAPAAHELAEKLSDALDTRVKVDIGRHKGRITVEFATIADLERIVDIMLPGLNPRVTEPAENDDEPAGNDD